MDKDDGPKHRLEHSISDKAGCQQAGCKREGIKIAKGELRISTQSWFQQDEKYITVWRHWRCATPHQIKALKLDSGGVVENIPGYAHLSPESQEQVRLALETERVTDGGFTDIRPDLAKFPSSSGYEIRNAVGYKVELAGRGTAGCRNAGCKDKGTKIGKGELRLGIATMWDEDHETWVYKHWECVSTFDLREAQKHFDQESLQGFDNLPKDYRKIILDSFEQGRAIEAPKPVPPPPKTKKPRKKKKADIDNDDEDIAVAKTSKSRKRKKKDDDDDDDDA